jgi:hypothetical protein
MMGGSREEHFDDDDGAVVGGNELLAAALGVAAGEVVAVAWRGEGGGREGWVGADEEVSDAGVAFGAAEVDGEESKCVSCEWVGPGGEKSMYDGGYLNAHGDVEE